LAAAITAEMPFAPQAGLVEELTDGLRTAGAASGDIRLVVTAALLRTPASASGAEARRAAVDAPAAVAAATCTTGLLRSPTLLARVRLVKEVGVGGAAARLGIAVDAAVAYEGFGVAGASRGGAAAAAAGLAFSVSAWLLAPRGCIPASLFFALAAAGFLEEAVAMESLRGDAVASGESCASTANGLRVARGVDDIFFSFWYAACTNHDGDGGT